jgi:hypothetical protein
LTVRPIQLRRTNSDTNVPLTAPFGMMSVATGPVHTKVWVGDGTANRLLLSTNSADTPIFAIPTGGPYLPLAGGVLNDVTTPIAGGLSVTNTSAAAGAAAIIAINNSPNLNSSGITTNTTTVGPGIFSRTTGTGNALRIEATGTGTGVLVQALANNIGLGIIAGGTAGNSGSGLYLEASPGSITDAKYAIQINQGVATMHVAIDFQGRLTLSATAQASWRTALGI